MLVNFEYWGCYRGKKISLENESQGCKNLFMRNMHEENSNI